MVLRTLLESASAFDPGAWKTTIATADLLFSSRLVLFLQRS